VQLPAVFLLLAVALPQTTSTDPLTRARQAYNDRRFDDAIAAAGEAGKLTGLAEAASLVAARAMLERYREAAVPNEADLSEARQVLKGLDQTKLSARDHVEFLVGLGEALYLENNFGAAEVYFSRALARVGVSDADTRERIFEWWATTLDHQAQFGPQAARRPLYTRILARAEEELARRESSAVASYWLAAAAQGVDDLERAWGAAQAGWIHAGHLGPRGAQLRADLDRLVRQVILPERARRLTHEGDPRAALDIFLTEWEDFKKQWERESIVGNSRDSIEEMSREFSIIESRPRTLFVLSN
jgi:hypothetical protein